MPLVDNINLIDVSRAMTARSKNLRRYRVGNDQDFIDYIETVDSVTYEYPRTTEEAAKNAIELIKNQTTPENTTANASMVEDVRNVGSYKVIVTTTTTTTTEAAVAPAPEVGGITWSRNSENVTTWPQEITASTSNPNDKIWYRIDAIKSDGRTQSGEWVNSNSNSVNISVNSDVYAAGFGGYHKRVFVYAEARRTQLTGETYAGIRTNRVFAQLVPYVATPTINTSFTIVSDRYRSRLDGEGYPSSGGSYTITASSGATTVHRSVSAVSQIRLYYGPIYRTDTYQETAWVEGLGGTITGTGADVYYRNSGGIGYTCKIVRIQAISYIQLDGITYESGMVTQYARRGFYTHDSY